MRAILIDTTSIRTNPIARMDDVIKVVEYETLDDVRRYIGAEMLEIATTNSSSLNEGHVLWCDEEALLKPEPPTTGLAMRPDIMVFGNCMITGMVNGELTDASVPLGFIQTLFIGAKWQIFSKK